MRISGEMIRAIRLLHQKEILKQARRFRIRARFDSMDQMALVQAAFPGEDERAKILLRAAQKKLKVK